MSFCNYLISIAYIPYPHQMTPLSSSGWFENNCTRQLSTSSSSLTFNTKTSDTIVRQPDVPMDIWEPCNYVSNLAYDRLMVEMCLQQVYIVKALVVIIIIVIMMIIRTGHSAKTPLRRSPKPFILSPLVPASFTAVKPITGQHRFPDLFFCVMFVFV